MWLAGSLGKYKHKQQQAVSVRRFPFRMFQSCRLWVETWREPQSTLSLVEKEECTFHYLKHPLFLRTQTQVPQGWPAFPLTRKWVLEGFLLCLSILPGCGTPANFLTSLVLLVHFNFFLYFLFPIATYMPPVIRISRKHGPLWKLSC